MFFADILWPGLGWLAGGGLISWILFLWKQRHRSGSAGDSVEMAQREAEAIRREARLATNEEIFQLRGELEKSLASRKKEITDLEQRLAQRDRKSVV